MVLRARNKNRRLFVQAAVSLFAKGVDGQESGGFLQGADGLAAGKAGVQLMPVGDLFFAHAPTEVDIASLVAAEEINQARLVVLQLDADFIQLMDVILEPFEDRFELLLKHAGIFRRGDGLKLGLEFHGSAMGIDDIANDSSYQGK